MERARRTDFIHHRGTEDTEDGQMAFYKSVGTLCKETHDNVIRFAPPLVSTRDELDWAFDRVGEVL
jgi:acetylornithine/succinyldiaminopimelate/putrescine aminotransferase